MDFTRTKTFRKILPVAIPSATIAVALFVWSLSQNAPRSERAELLRFVPQDATSVVFIDFDNLRSSPFLTTLYAWAPTSSEDLEYKEFTAETGFRYERDLTKVFIAISHRGSIAQTVAIADGQFDRRKIESYLARISAPLRQGKLNIFRVRNPSELGQRAISVIFLSDQRVVVTDAEDVQAVAAQNGSDSARKEWQQRFERLAGSPLFAVIRQDPTVYSALASQSPRLATFIEQLPWISVAGKPEGNFLRIVAEGETVSDITASQLADFLKGIQLLALNGLQDPGLRKQMDSEERDAYLELMRAVQIEQIGRGDTKAVRVVFTITPRVLELARNASVTPRATEPAAPKQSGRRR